MIGPGKKLFRSRNKALVEQKGGSVKDFPFLTPVADPHFGKWARKKTGGG